MEKLVFNKIREKYYEIQSGINPVKIERDIIDMINLIDELLQFDIPDRELVAGTKRSLRKTLTMEMDSAKIARGKDVEKQLYLLKERIKNDLYSILKLLNID